MAGSSPDLYPQVALGTVIPCKSTAEVTEAAEAGWISTMRPSRRPLRGLLRLRNFLNAIKSSPHAEGAHGARLEARTASMQLFCPRSAFGHRRRVSLTVRCTLTGNDQGQARSSPAKTKADAAIPLLPAPHFPRTALRERTQSVTPCSSQSLPLAKAGGQAPDPRFLRG
jgi:hypothetical protein